MATATTHAPLGAATILHAVDKLFSTKDLLVAWNNARKTRQVLSRLSDTRLEDIGLTREDVAKL